MLGPLAHLALEVKHLDPAAAFYREHLELATVEETERAVALDVGGPRLVLRAPGGVPRGGLHTHYALSTGDYDAWHERLSESFDLEQHRFGDSRSLYFYDSEGNCVEIGERGDGAGITGLFEVVLEVAELPRAESFYTALGFEPVDRGSDRRRVRLTTGTLDLELWEPHLGLADARGGVHVDFGVEASDPTAVADRVREEAPAVERLEEGVRLRDPDGHHLSLVR
jgi:catechol-2,3-dioxygenase